MPQFARLRPGPPLAAAPAHRVPGEALAAAGDAAHAGARARSPGAGGPLLARSRLQTAAPGRARRRASPRWTATRRGGRRGGSWRTRPGGREGPPRAGRTRRSASRRGYVSTRWPSGAIKAIPVKEATEKGGRVRAAGEGKDAGRHRGRGHWQRPRRKARQLADGMVTAATSLRSDHGGGDRRRRRPRRTMQQWPRPRQTARRRQRPRRKALWRQRSRQMARWRQQPRRTARRRQRPRRTERRGWRPRCAATSPCRRQRAGVDCGKTKVILCKGLIRLNICYWQRATALAVCHVPGGSRTGVPVGYVALNQRAQAGHHAPALTAHRCRRRRALAATSPAPPRARHPGLRQDAGLRHRVLVRGGTTASTILVGGRRAASATASSFAAGHGLRHPRPRRDPGFRHCVQGIPVPAGSRPPPSLSATRRRPPPPPPRPPPRRNGGLRHHVLVRSGTPASATASLSAARPRPPPSSSSAARRRPPPPRSRPRRVHGFRHPRLRRDHGLRHRVKRVHRVLVHGGPVLRHPGPLQDGGLRHRVLVRGGTPASATTSLSAAGRRPPLPRPRRRRDHVLRHPCPLQDHGLRHPRP